VEKGCGNETMCKGMAHGGKGGRGGRWSCLKNQGIKIIHVSITVRRTFSSKNKRGERGCLGAKEEEGGIRSVIHKEGSKFNGKTSPHKKKMEREVPYVDMSTFLAIGQNKKERRNAAVNGRSREGKEGKGKVWRTMYNIKIYGGKRDVQSTKGAARDTREGEGED